LNDIGKWLLSDNIEAVGFSDSSSLSERWLEEEDLNWIFFIVFSLLLVMMLGVWVVGYRVGEILEMVDVVSDTGFF